MLLHVFSSSFVSTLVQSEQRGSCGMDRSAGMLFFAGPWLPGQCWRRSAWQRLRLYLACKPGNTTCTYILNILTYRPLVLSSLTSAKLSFATQTSQRRRVAYSPLQALQHSERTLHLSPKHRRLQACRFNVRELCPQQRHNISFAKRGMPACPKPSASIGKSNCGDVIPQTTPMEECSSNYTR